MCFIIFTEYVDDYCIKRIILSKVLSLCNNDPNLESIEISYKEQNEIDYLKFLCSKFDLNCIPGKKQIQIQNIEKIKENKNKNYLKFEEFCEKNKLDVEELKDLSYDRKKKLINKCKRYNIRYNEITYSVISKKKDYEKDPYFKMKFIQKIINKDDQKSYFLNVREEYYKVKVLYIYIYTLNKHFKYFSYLNIFNFNNIDNFFKYIYIYI